MHICGEKYLILLLAKSADCRLGVPLCNWSFNYSLVVDNLYYEIAKEK